ncbi:MAG TPA: NAD-dependent epimerase/dehydratase family protein [Streptosporangiaceae bacterium]|nr:NAD-dependent epimerase/dehydratase family protein [Streptosporangiaceae bacterium]
MTPNVATDRPVLVTGASGFIGGAIARSLRAQGRSVVSIDVTGTPDLRMDAADTRVLDAIRHGTYHAVVHQAGISNTLERDRKRLLENNTRKPLELADAAAEARVLFIYASSFSVYGNTGRRSVSEADIASSSGPLNPYAESKLRLDQEMAARFAGGDWLGLRYTNAFGPNEPTHGRMASVISKWLQQSASGQPIEIFDGTEDSGRDFVEVDRITAVILRRLARSTQPKPCGVFNLGSGTTVTFGELIDWCRDFSGQPPAIRAIPFTIGHQYQHWTSADMTALIAYYPDLGWGDRRRLKEYAGLCWRAFRASAKERGHLAETTFRPACQ